MADDENNKKETTSKYCICFDDINRAASRINGIAHRTPVMTSSSIDRMLMKTIIAKKNSNDKKDDDPVLPTFSLHFKVEALQKTGSFKFRGAYNAIQSELEQQQQQQQQQQLEVVTHSSGNHAGAVALASKLLGAKATIVMPENTPIVKKRAVEDFGAKIVIVKSTNEARKAMADQIMKEKTTERQSKIFVHPSENPRVIAGQGTVGHEFIKQMNNDQKEKKLDIIVIPVGGGGLAAGNIITFREIYGNQVKIVLAEPCNVDDAYRSFYSGKLCGHDASNGTPPTSVADGLKTVLGPNTWPIIRDMADDIITVSETQILQATKVIWERLKVCIEPSAGVGVAAVLYSEIFHQKYLQTTTENTNTQQNIGIILCGGNVDVVKVSKQMEQENI